MKKSNNDNSNNSNSSCNGIEKIENDFAALRADLKDLSSRMDNVTYRDFVERVIANIDLQHAKLAEFEKAAELVYTICKGENA